MPLPCLRLSDLSPEGMRLDCQISAGELELNETDVQASEAFALHAELLPVEKEVIVRGVVSGRVGRQCVRCLKEYEATVELPFTAQYCARRGELRHGTKQPELGSQESSEEIATLTEGELYSYTGDRLDLVPMLREQIILASPMQPLCHQDCRGLCPTCGQDRNLKLCGCVEDQLPNPFLVLKGRREKPRDSSKRG